MHNHAHCCSKLAVRSFATRHSNITLSLCAHHIAVILQVASQLTDAQVDQFCAAATNPAMAKAARTMNEVRTAAATQARIQWQQSVSTSGTTSGNTSAATPAVPELANPTAARMRRAGFDTEVLPAGAKCVRERERE
jgi:type IV secretory pathway TrbL component